MPDPVTQPVPAAAPSPGPAYRLARWAAVFAGAFSVVVLALLIANHFSSQKVDPKQPAEIAALKKQLREDRANKELRTEIRTRDLTLRRSFFHHRWFADHGAYLLVGGVAVGLLALKLADSARPKEIVLVGMERRGRASVLAARGRQAVGALGLVCAGGATALAVMAGGTFLAGNGAGFPEPIPAGTPGLPSTGGNGTGTTAALPAPTPEDFKKNWPMFRGPGAAGVSAFANVPTEWDGATGKNILWKAAIPLSGYGSPVVWGKRLFVSGGDDQKREVYCFDADTGKLLWQKAVAGALPLSEGKPLNPKDETGFAPATMATDGQRVFAIFTTCDVAAFDLNGKQLWVRRLPLPDNLYGQASSLSAYQGLLYVQFDQGAADDNADITKTLSKLLALDAQTGKTVWEVKRPVGASWSTPVVLDAGGKPQLVTCAEPWVIAYDPLKGTELWRASCLKGEQVPTAVLTAGGLIVVVGPAADMTALKPDGAGDVTKTHIAWQAKDAVTEITSPLAAGDLVYLVTSQGEVYVFDAKTGAAVWDHDFRQTFYASPSLVGDKLYLITDKGETRILAAGREFKELGLAKLGENVSASPAFGDGRIYLRGRKNLYCIGK